MVISAWLLWGGALEAQERPARGCEAGGAGQVLLHLCLRIQKIQQFYCGMNHVAVAEVSYHNISLMKNALLFHIFLQLEVKIVCERRM